MIPALLAYLLLAAAGAVEQDPLEADREKFLQARTALQQNRLQAFKRLAGQLQDYPLYPYLEFEELRNRLDQANEREVAGFIERHADQPVGARMRRMWLYSLARDGKWVLFLKHYREPQPVKLQCYALQARLHTGRNEGLAADAIGLWLVGKSQEKPCDPVFDYLYEKNHITDALLWQRIRLAIANGQTSLAGYLAKRLPERDAAVVKLYREAHRNPAETLPDPALAADTPINREIILHAVRRIARWDAPQAHRKWQSLKTRYAFSPEESAGLERGIALSASWERIPQAHDWLVAVPEPAVDEEVREWRTRTAVAESNWPAIVEHINAMPAAEADREEWRYWQALALEKTGQRIKAMDRLSRLAQERDYHGFLAADFLHWPYEMNNRRLVVEPETLAALKETPGFIRAHELFKAKLFTDARREWAAASVDLTINGLKAAAELARQWGWHERAILTVATTGDYDDLLLRFPLDYEDSVKRIARHNKLDPGHVYAVMRQESAFNKDARSPAGAIGLMQLMPKTGQVTARKNRIGLSGSRELFLPEKNIQIGSAYLRQVLERYDQNLVLASAAYNAGPQRVNRWLPEKSGMAAANWIARIPFNETRKYVQRILAYAAIYDWRLGRPVIPLKKRMPDIFTQAYYDRFKQ
ncbi:MAG: transglycosylase SLT domain-containing protein [Gammaproteobacteria bacterium]